MNNDIADWDNVPLDPKDLLYDFKRIIKPDGNIFVFTSYNLIGKWHEVFNNDNPIYLEIGMGKGKFIHTLAELNHLPFLRED